MIVLFERYQMHIPQQFIENCIHGKLEFVKQFIRYNFHIIHNDVNDGLLCACRYGHLDIVQFLLTYSKHPLNIDIHYCYANQNTPLENACEFGHLDIVKYLLTSPELTEHADIHHDNDYCFVTSAQKGHLDIVHYLLTSSDLKTHADIHVRNDIALRSAADRDQVEMVKYLLTSPNLKEHASLHVENDRPFKNVCLEKDSLLAHFFIFTLNIEKTNDIIDYIREYRLQHIEELFNKRDFYHSLNEQVNYDKEIETQHHRKKI